MGGKQNRNVSRFLLMFKALEIVSQKIPHIIISYFKYIFIHSECWSPPVNHEGFKIGKPLTWNIGVVVKIIDQSGLFFLYFCLFSSKTVKMLKIKFCQWPDSNQGYLVSEATTLPTESQPLPNDVAKLFKNWI